jgi:hypothetical protein
VLLVTGCGGETPSNSTTVGDPAAGAKAFFDALYAGNSVDSMVCSTEVETATAIKSSMEQMRDVLAANGAVVDASGLTYTVANQTAETADVTVGGNLRVTVAETGTDTPFPSSTIRMRNEGGTWKVCG